MVGSPPKLSPEQVGIPWIFGNPFGPTAPSVSNPKYAELVAVVMTILLIA